MVHATCNRFWSTKQELAAANDAAARLHHKSLLYHAKILMQLAFMRKTVLSKLVALFCFCLIFQSHLFPFQVSLFFGLFTAGQIPLTPKTSIATRTPQDIDWCSSYLTNQTTCSTYAQTITTSLFNRYSRCNKLTILLHTPISFVFNRVCAYDKLIAPCSASGKCQIMQYLLPIFNWVSTTGELLINSNSPKTKPHVIKHRTFYFSRLCYFW